MLRLGLLYSYVILLRPLVTNRVTLRRKRRSMGEKNSLIILTKYFLLLAVCTRSLMLWLFRLLWQWHSRVHKNKTYYTSISCSDATQIQARQFLKWDHHRSRFIFAVLRVCRTIHGFDIKPTKRKINCCTLLSISRERWSGIWLCLFEWRKMNRNVECECKVIAREYITVRFWFDFVYLPRRETHFCYAIQFIILSNKIIIIK